MSDGTTNGGRLRQWWLEVHAKPVPYPTDPGRAAVPYPPSTRGQRHAFAQSEEYLLREIVHAGGWTRHVNARGDLTFVAPWLIQPRRVHASLMDDTKGRGPSRAQMQEVVDWLASHGALRALSDEHRNELVRSGEVERAAEGRTGGSVYDSPEYRARVEDMYREWDHNSCEVIPVKMLHVYPHLADADQDWQDSAGRAGEA
ncbi:hypothetical protein FDK12_11935 [Arthrobacter sp. NamB2]|uniref:hypothetical protein n=1 Tax=Arthrobacter sp. NamB2 TaxID=2576035 RepID=UPI0010C9D4AD|nr:hypothetical protein [Arthrobacter sp. NamB2]TKV27407.1 hypothetical protein FDK12_11935 [Arthrobacter sp. NamB2]